MRAAYGLLFLALSACPSLGTFTGGDGADSGDDHSLRGQDADSPKDASQSDAGSDTKDAAVERPAMLPGPVCGAAIQCKAGVVCCWSDTGDLDSAVCVPPSVCPGGVTFVCSQGNDCASSHCCGHWLGKGTVVYSSCEPESCPDGSVELCNPETNPCVGDAGTCMSLEGPVGYYACQ
jgi:hypothetical protein